MNFYLLFKKGFADLPRPILRVMKLTIVILTTFLLQVSAAGFAQKVSLKEKDASIVDVFKAIRQQTGYDFVYTTKQIQKAKKVSIDVQNLPLGEVLEKCFEDQPFTYEIEEKAIIIQAKTENVTTALPVQVADQLVKGVVKDEVGVQLQNVTVYVEGTSIGTTTDAHGEFSIKADVGAKLHFTLVGYAPVVIELKNKTTLTVSMHILNSQLGEIVVIGYGQTAKADLTSAVSTINAAQITEMPTTNLSQVFAGRVPGVLARTASGIAGSENATLLVRTTNGSQAPLLVVDGVPRFSINSNNQVNLNSIDPSEVESITVLKDNAATAVYGSQGANGVIIVTTKRGKTGKPQFSYSGNYTLSSPAKMAQQLDGYDYALYQNAYYINSGLTARYSAAVLDTIQNNLEPNKYANTNWVKLLTQRQSFVSNQNLNITGGSDAIKYFILGSYADEGGMYATNNYKRYTFQNNLDIKLSDEFKAQVNLSYRNSVQNLPSGGDPMNAAFNASPLAPVYNANGSYSSAQSGSATNPLAAISSAAGFNTTTYNYGTADGRLTYTPKFLPGLSAYANFYVEKSFMREKIYTVPVPLYIVSPSSSTGYAQTGGSGNPSLEDEYTDANTYTEDFALNYDKHWGKSTLSALVLYTVAGNSYNQNTDTRLNLVAPGLPIINLGSTTGETTTGTSNQLAREGYVGRITYDFDKRFYAEGSFRDDGSSYFAPGKRWGFFPGGSLGWVVSKEGFFQSLTSVVDVLKIRGSLGLTGDDNIGANTYYYTYKVANTGVQNTQGYVFGTTYTPTFYLANSTLPNADITWAKNREENLGFDADLWHGRLGVIFDIYQKDRYDMLISQTSNLPSTFGIGGPIENMGKQRDRGFEVDLTSQNRFDNNWSLALNANFTYVQTTVINGGTLGLPAYEQLEGYSTNTLVGYHAVGIFQNQQQINAWPVDQDGQKNATIKPGDIKYADENGDGKLTPADEKTINNYGFPPINFGFGFTLKYKSVSLTTTFSGALDGYIRYSPTAYTWQYIYDNSWSPSNPTAMYPRIASSSNNTLPSDIGLFKDNFLRLRDLRLGYDLPTRWTNALKIKSVKIFAEASNLLTWTTVQGGIDPETPNLGTGGATPGFTPNQKNIGLGINVNF